MAIKVTPTKANLIKSKASLAFSAKGYNLLDKKRTVLIQEIMKLVKQSEEIEAKITEIFKEAYTALQQASIGMGLNHVEEYALSIPQEEPFETRTRSVMGVDIPEIVDQVNPNKNFSLPFGFSENNPALDVAIEKFNEAKLLSYVMGVDIPEIVDQVNPNKNFSLPFGFSENNPALDVAIEKFNEAKLLSYQLAEIEGTAFKLSLEIKKTQKSANALDKIQIPKLQEQIKYIEESIEEKDREENFRIKKVKKHNQK